MREWIELNNIHINLWKWLVEMEIFDIIGHLGMGEARVLKTASKMVNLNLDGACLSDLAPLWVVVVR